MTLKGAFTSIDTLCSVMTAADFTPDEAFSLLGQGTRVAIIQRLGDARGEPLTFSELRDAVGVEDSGQFNYHLGKLVGSFVTRTEEGTYELSYAGHRVVGAILSGEFNRHSESDVIPLDSACAACGAELVATYEDETVSIRCPVDDGVSTSFGFPPGAFEDRTTEELIEAFDDWLFHVLGLIADGICYNCAGKMSGVFTRESRTLRHEEFVGIRFACARCADSAVMSVTTYLLFHPAVRSFHYNHGVDLSSIPAWTLDVALEYTVDVISEDPWTVETVFDVDGDQVTLFIEDDLTVREV